MSLVQAYGGNIADKFNRRALVIAGSVINLTYLALIPVASDFWQLLGICALGGLGGASAMPAASALTVDEGRKFGMGSAMAAFSMAFSIGMAIGPLLSGVIADYISVNSVFYFGALAGLIGTGLFIWFTR
jgi:MFS family permease